MRSTRKGAYVLFLRISKRCEIRIGKLGTFGFPKGEYAYVGSGMKGVETRVLRHLSESKRLHWHIDYLLEVGEVIGFTLFPCEERIECVLNDFVSGLPGSIDPVKGFGSSDCDCFSHLHLLSLDAMGCLQELIGVRYELYCSMD
ncbi:MAG: GIY-YIG nuclease family protein [Methanomassiliicoccales archaeon]|nr:GIY-YIG nuclease family protein [Methanomassiliicoccales archaeon]